MIRYPAYAKVNVFLKITGTRGEYHTLTSRFVLVKELCDLLWFESKTTPEFEIRGDFDCDVGSNTIYKAYKHLQSATRSNTLAAFFETHAVCVDKRIPSFAGLGGGSSDAATFYVCATTPSSWGSQKRARRNPGKRRTDVPFSSQL